MHKQMALFEPWLHKWVAFHIMHTFTHFHFSFQLVALPDYHRELWWMEVQIGVTI
jgi:hypothetical protein